MSSCYCVLWLGGCWLRVISLIMPVQRSSRQHWRVRHEALTYWSSCALVPEEAPTVDGTWSEEVRVNGYHPVERSNLPCISTNVGKWQLHAFKHNLGEVFYEFSIVGSYGGEGKLAISTAAIAALPAACLLAGCCPRSLRLDRVCKSEWSPGLSRRHGLPIQPQKQLQGPDVFTYVCLSHPYSSTLSLIMVSHRAMHWRPSSCQWNKEVETEN